MHETHVDGPPSYFSFMWAYITPQTLVVNNLEHNMFDLDVVVEPSELYDPCGPHWRLDFHVTTSYVESSNGMVGWDLAKMSVLANLHYMAWSGC